MWLVLTKGLGLELSKIDSRIWASPEVFKDIQLPGSLYYPLFLKIDKWKCIAEFQFYFISHQTSFSFGFLSNN